MAMTHEVVKAFDADRRLKSGEKVDASGWLNTELLVKQGMLRPLGTVRAGAEAGDGSALMQEVLAQLRSIEGRLRRLEASTDGADPTPPPKVPAVVDGDDHTETPINQNTEEAPLKAPGKTAPGRRKKKSKSRAKTATARTAAPAEPVPPVTALAEKE